jgi:hypothetical protein
MGLFCCYSGTRCERGPFVADGAEPDDALVFPISIGKAVGLGAPNDPDDVRTIQQALNRFPESMGGPKPKLKPDGIVGRLTAGAIEKFQRRQLGFTDQKIDPDKRTIKKLIRRRPAAGSSLAPWLDPGPIAPLPFARSARPMDRCGSAAMFADAKPYVMWPGTPYEHLMLPTK